MSDWGGDSSQIGRALLSARGELLCLRVEPATQRRTASLSEPQVKRIRK
jgi:hypothetical protein